MRRYAYSFTGAFKREAASISRIQYARVRDIVGNNDPFVWQNGTFSYRFSLYLMIFLPMRSGIARVYLTIYLQMCSRGRKSLNRNRDSGVSLEGWLT